MPHISVADILEKFAKAFTIAWISSRRKLCELLNWSNFVLVLTNLLINMVLHFGTNEILSFENEEVPSVLGLKVIQENCRDG